MNIWNISIHILIYITIVTFTGYWSIEVMVFNATFNNISAILWQSVLLVEEADIPRENHQPVASH